MILTVFDNTTARNIFGPKRKAVTGGCRRWHYEELHDLYS